MLVLIVDHETLSTQEIAGGAEAALLLDHKTYFDPGHRQSLLSRELPRLNLHPSAIFSTYEAIGAFLQTQTPDIDGSIQVIDIDPNDANSATIGFTNGRYHFDHRATHRSIRLEPLWNKHLGLMSNQIANFESFLQTAGPGEKPFGESVWTAIQQHSLGNEEYNDLLAVLDNEAYALITIESLIRLKAELLEELGIDLKAPYLFTGLLSAIFSERYSPSNPKAVWLGVQRLIRLGGAFYAPATTSVALQAFAYPAPLRLTLYQAGSPFEAYSTPKKIKLVDNGDITFYRDDVPVLITGREKTLYPLEIEFYMDGNQHITVTAGTQTYLL